MWSHLLYTVVIANQLACWTLDKPMASLSTCHLELVVWEGNLVKSMQWRQSLIIAQYHFTEIFMVFNDELSKSTMATMADGITSTADLLSYVLDRLFDSFSEESLSDVDDRNNDDVGELSD